MFGQRDEHPKVLTLRKKEEIWKKEETQKNTTVAIPMNSAKNNDSENDNEGDAYKVSLLIINGCIFPRLWFIALYIYYSI